jgi:flagellar motor switch protein FliG
MSVKLKGVQKVAVLLAVLGDEASAEVMSRFDPHEQERVGQAMVELEEQDLEESVIAEVVQEFKDMCASGVAFRSNLTRTLAGMMGRLYGADEASERLTVIRDESRSRQPFRVLRGIRSQDLARILMDEHPQIQALVLANLDADHAASILEEIPEEAQSEIVTRMASMEEPSARMLKQVAQVMLERTVGLRRDGPSDEPGTDVRYRVVADILNATEPGVDKEILRRVEEQDEELSVRIRDRMFTWGDLKLLDRRTTQKILAGIDTKVLALALKATDEEVQEAILSATSQRTRDMILEERELLGSVPLKEVLESQRQILVIVRELIDAGEITVSKGKGTAYVQ